MHRLLTSVHKGATLSGFFYERKKELTKMKNCIRLHMHLARCQMSDQKIRFTESSLKGRIAPNILNKGTVSVNSFSVSVHKGKSCVDFFYERKKELTKMKNYTKLHMHLAKRQMSDLTIRDARTVHQGRVVVNILNKRHCPCTDC